MSASDRSKVAISSNSSQEEKKNDAIARRSKSEKALIFSPGLAKYNIKTFKQDHKAN